MSRWTSSGEGTFYREVKRARKQRRCEDCRRPLEVGEPYVEHRAAPWSEWGSAYSIATCGIKLGDCPGAPR